MSPMGPRGQWEGGEGAQPKGPNGRTPPGQARGLQENREGILLRGIVKASEYPRVN